jgi:Sjoegren syndrome nuclear autoantigen 1
MSVRLGGSGDAVALGNELDATLAKLKRKCEILGMKMKENELKKQKLILKIENATKRHQRCVARLGNRKDAQKEYQKTIAQTESAYQKIVDSSSTLLEVLKVQAGDSDPEEIPDVGTTAEMDKKKSLKSQAKAKAEEQQFTGLAIEINQDMEAYQFSYAG